MRDLIFGFLIFVALTTAVLANLPVIGLVAGGVFALIAYLTGSPALRGTPDRSSEDSED